MIKAIILDIDGVIVGDKPGFNFPHPHPEVVDILKKITSRGIQIHLCTAKPSRAIESILLNTELTGPHITDAGAVLYYPTDTSKSVAYHLPKTLAKDVLVTYHELGIYHEMYTVENYHIRKEHNGDVTKKRTNILGKDPILLTMVEEFLEASEIIKIFLLAKDQATRQLIQKTFDEKFDNDLTLSWTAHPTTLPWQYGIVTVKGVSKQQGAREIAKAINVPLENILGVGDTMHDWQFIEVCGYGAAMGNATDELKNLVLSKGEKGYVGPHVNEHGIIDILKHFISSVL